MKQLVRFTGRNGVVYVERMGYAVVLLVLVGFLLVGQFIPDPQATIFDQFLRLFALFGIVLFGLGRWVLKSPHSR